MPAQPRPGIKRLEAERLGLGRVDHFPDVDAHAVEEHLQLVDQRDVHGAVGVFEDLAGLGHLAVADGNHFGHGLAIKLHGQPRLRGSTPPTTLGMFPAVKFGLPGSSRSGLKARKKSLPSFRPVSRRIGSTTSRVVPG